MALKLGPTGLGSGIDNDRLDYTVYCGEWAIGRIYQARGGSEHLRWFWSFTAVSGPMTRSNRVATLEEAKAQFQKSWEAWKRGRSWKRAIRQHAGITHVVPFRINALLSTCAAHPQQRADRLTSSGA